MSNKKHANFYTDRKFKNIEHNDVKNIEEELNKKREWFEENKK